jgi:hypothetical protein
VKGTKDIIITAIADNKTRVDVQWDIKVKGFFGIIKKHISEGSEDALERISKAAQS